MPIPQSFVDPCQFPSVTSLADADSLFLCQSGGHKRIEWLALLQLIESAIGNGGGLGTGSADFSKLVVSRTSNAVLTANGEVVTVE